MSTQSLEPIQAGDIIYEVNPPPDRQGSYYEVALPGEYFIYAYSHLGQLWHFKREEVAVRWKVGEKPA